MNVVFRRSFAKDLKKLKHSPVKQRVQAVITNIEEASALSEIHQLTKISGTSNFYRIRIGNYRIGIVIEGDEVEFVRCLHRRDIYRYFP